MIPDIQELTTSINHVYSTAYNQGLDHAINVVIAFAEIDKIEANVSLFIIESIEKMKTK